MFKVVRELVILPILLFNFAFAISEISTFEDDEKKLIETILFKELKLNSPEIDKEKLINRISPFFKYILKEKGWYAFWISNNSLKLSKFKDSKHRFVYLVLNNKKRIYNMYIGYFPTVYQLMIVISEFPCGDAETILKLYKQLKSDKNYIIKADTENFAVLQKKGQIDYSIFRISGKHGLINYVSAFVIDVPRR